MNPKALSIHDFIPIAQLGSGSFGQVYLAEKKDSGHKFAMKVLDKKKILGENILKYIQTERDILTKIDHPFIVHLNCSFQSAYKLFLVLEYCPCGDVGDVLKKERRFSE